MARRDGWRGAALKHNLVGGSNKGASWPSLVHAVASLPAYGAV